MPASRSQEGLVFLELENAAKVDTGAFDSLKPTWQRMLAQLQKKPILLLTYRELPPLFEDALFGSVSHTALGEGPFEHVSSDLEELPRARRTLFLVPSNVSSSVSEVLRSIAKHLVESNGEARFLVVFSSKREGELRRDVCFPLLQQYIGRFESVVQNPLSFLTQFTGLSQLPAYAERRLWELLFYAAVLALERIVLDEEQLQGLATGLKVVETIGGKCAFYEWNALPPQSRFARVYFASMDISGADESIVREDEQFYLANCFRRFVEWGAMGQCVHVVAPDTAAQLQLMATLREWRVASQRSAEAVQFWQRLGFKYLLCESRPPYQSMGSIDSHVQDDPRLRDLVEKVGQIIGGPSPFEDRETFIEASGVAFKWLYPIVASQDTLNISLIDGLLNDFLWEHQRRLSEYDDPTVQSLLVKTMNVAVVTCACLGLHGRRLSNEGFALFPRLWSRCLDRLGASFAMPKGQREELSRGLTLLGSFDVRFKRVAAQQFMRAEEIAAIEAMMAEALTSEDPLSAFFAFFASQVQERDLFRGLGEWRSLALRLAKSYSELDDRLLQRQSPFTHQWLRARELPNLVSKAQDDSDFDRVFILVIDGLSYLEWQLVGDYFRDLSDEGIALSDGYALAPVPTYTPPNTTCLITGFHPSEIGVCDWKIKALGQSAFDLKDEAARPIIKGIGEGLNIRHSVTVVHSQGGSNLTYLWTRLAKLEEISLASTESRKAIAQVRGLLHELDPANKVVVVYIADFDEAGHWHLTMDGWEEYYSLLGKSIRRNLLQPIFRRAERRKEKTLVVLTADHGKFSRYESRLLGLVVPRSGAFEECAALLEGYEFSKSSRHIVAWIPENDLPAIRTAVDSVVKDAQDVIVYTGDEVRHLLPYASKTNLLNPNLIILLRFGISTGGVMGHGGSSLSEVVVPAVRFSREQAP